MFVEKENYYYIEEFENLGIKAVYTKKNMGNMSDFCPLENQVEGIQLENRKKLLDDLEMNEKQQVFAFQTHSNNVKVIDESTDKYYYEKEYDIDGFVTNRKDVAIFTFYADCLPIFVYDKKNAVIGVWHSGWPGTFKGILQSGLELMNKTYGSKMEDILVAFGIGMQDKFYEVGNEFYEKFIKKYGENSELIQKSFWFNENTKKYHFDNIKFNEIRALNLGIKKENIIIASEDTYSEKDKNGQYKFHSHRREGKMAGRATAMISFK